MRLCLRRGRKPHRRGCAEAQAGAGGGDRQAGVGFAMIRIFVVFLAALASSAHAQSVAEFYAGRQISMIVGSTAGGGYDTQGRLVAKHLGRHIPGNPTIVVQNMPAAGSLAATNHMYNVAAKDGSAIG